MEKLPKAGSSFSFQSGSSSASFFKGQLPLRYDALPLIILMIYGISYMECDIWYIIIMIIVTIIAAIIIIFVILHIVFYILQFIYYVYFIAWYSYSTFSILCVLYYMYI